MKVLIAEDDMASRKFMQRVMSRYGECDLVVDGMEALDAFLMAQRDQAPYDLICLDIMMPKVDGVKVLKAIRDYEAHKGIPQEQRVRIIMTTALAETPYVRQSFDMGCEAYASKPIDTEKLVAVLKELKLIPA